MKRFAKTLSVLMLMTAVVCAAGCKKLDNVFSGSNAPQGAIDGKFTVNEFGKQVYFSKGNLQYQPSTNTWRFADRQYDICVSTEDCEKHYYHYECYHGVEEITEEEFNDFIASHSGYYNYEGYDYAQEERVWIGDINVKSHYNSLYSGWIDFFAWGTSGFDHGATNYQPWCYGYEGDYYAYGQYNCSLYDNVGYADWGYNSISNGGNKLNFWRTMTKEEWDFVLNTRNTLMGVRYAHALVNNINGLVLFPDNWDNTVYTPNQANLQDANYSSNKIDLSKWTAMERHGAVFLPAAGLRRIHESDNTLMIEHAGTSGDYWTSSYDKSNYGDVRMVAICEGWLIVTNFDVLRSDGRSVRLVCPVEN